MGLYGLHGIFRKLVLSGPGFYVAWARSPDLSRAPHGLTEVSGCSEVSSGPLVVFRPQEEEEAQAEFGRENQKDRAGPASEEGEKQPPRSQEKPAGEASAPEGQQEDPAEKGESKVRPFLAGRGGRLLCAEGALCPSGTGRWCLPALCHLSSMGCFEPLSPLDG